MIIWFLKLVNSIYYIYWLLLFVKILNEEEYKIYSQKCTNLATSQLKNIFHCKKPDCTYFGILDDSNLAQFQCPICLSMNCVVCVTIHKDNETCEQYLSKKKLFDLKSLQYVEVSQLQ